MEKVTTGSDDLTCSVCHQRYSRLDTLLEHRQAVHGPCKSQCTICGKYFASTRSLKTHISSHSEEKPFSCETCSKSFGRKDSLKRHEQTHIQREIHCEYEGCEEVFASQLAYRRHLKSRTDELYVPSDEDEKCSCCEWREAEMSQSPPVHLVTIGEEKHHQCVHCFKTFNESEECHAVTRHLHDVHCSFERFSIPKWPHTKDVYTYKPKHRRVGKKCPICNKLFANKQEVQRHQETDHVLLGQADLNIARKCDYCSKPSAWDSDEHIAARRNHHLIPNRGKTYHQCIGCLDVFKDCWGYLAHHRKTSNWFSTPYNGPHEGMPPKVTFQCEQCLRLFGSRITLKNTGIRLVLHCQQHLPPLSHRHLQVLLTMNAQVLF